MYFHYHIILFNILFIKFTLQANLSTHLEDDISEIFDRFDQENFNLHFFSFETEYNNRILIDECFFEDLTFNNDDGGIQTFSISTTDNMFSKSNLDDEWQNFNKFNLDLDKLNIENSIGDMYNASASSNFPINLYYPLKNSHLTKNINCDHENNQQIGFSADFISYNDINNPYEHMENIEEITENSWNMKNNVKINFESIKNLKEDLRALDKKFYEYIIRKYYFKMDLLIKFCCNLKLRRRHRFLNISLDDTKKYMDFLNINNLIPLTDNEFVSDNINDFYKKNKKQFYKHVEIVLKELQHLFDIDPNNIFYKDLYGVMLNSNVSEKKNDLIIRQNNFLFNSKQICKNVLPELKFLVYFMNEYVSHSKKGRNNFFTIFSIVLSIFEIKKDKFLTIEQFSTESNTEKIFTHHYELLKIRSFLLVFYIKFLPEEPMLGRGIIICFINLIILNNWNNLKVSIITLHEYFNKTVDEVLNKHLTYNEKDLKGYKKILKIKMYKQIIFKFSMHILPLQNE